MSIWVLSAALLFVGVAAIHSVLGERLLLRPLFAGGLPPLALPASFARRTLRFAWHLTTVAWFGFAALLVVDDTAPVRGAILAVALISGAVAAAVSRGAHFAWTVFLAIVVLLVMSTGQLETTTVRTVAVGVGGVFAGLAFLHLYWAFGGRWGFLAAVPQVDGRPAFVPGRTITLLVAAALGSAATLAVIAGWTGSDYGRGAMALGAIAFAGRVVGDFRSCGLFKRPTRDRFAQMDTSVYVPLCFALASGCLILAAG